MATEETSSEDASPNITLHLQEKNKVKFFCSYGGMILPRPFDGNLKYVGGETRVISAHRSIMFSDLMSKINNMFEGEFVVKYQIGVEELDALVSVKSDEDLGYMFDEYDRLEKGGVSKLRTYLFRVKPSRSPSQSSDQNPNESHSPTSQSMEQRYVDALNGIVRLSSPFGGSGKRLASSSRLKSMCSSPSECGSPSSLSPHSIAHNNNNTCVNGGDSTSTAFINSLHGKLNSMTRVQSSPSLFGLAKQENNHHMCHAGYRQSIHHHHHQQHLLYQQQQQQQQHQSPWMSPARDLDYGRLPIISNHSPNVVPSTTQCHPFHKGGSGGHTRWAHLAQYSGPTYFA